MSKKSRHHSSKNFKKYSENKLKDRMINTEEPTESDMIVIEEMCKMWWNGLSNSKHIKKIVSELDLVPTQKEKENVLKPIYYNIANNSTTFKKGVSRALFTYNFILGVPFFKKWIKEEYFSTKKQLTGALQTQILTGLSNCKSMYKTKLLEQLEYYDYFYSSIQAMLTKMLKKGHIIEIGNCYKLGNVECFEDGFYFDKEK